eukprot:scaffold48063_cov28-Tisochrysis_lutea.AAC.1
MSGRCEGAGSGEVGGSEESGRVWRSLHDGAARRGDSRGDGVSWCCAMRHDGWARPSDVRPLTPSASRRAACRYLA